MIDMDKERSVFEMAVGTLIFLAIIATVCLVFWKMSDIQDIPSDSPNLYSEANYRAIRSLRADK